MNDLASLATLISAVGALIAAVGALAVGWRNSRKADDAREKALIAATKATIAADEAMASKAAVVKVGDEVFEVGKRIDGRLSELLALTEQSSLAKGRLEGAEAERNKNVAS